MMLIGINIDVYPFDWNKPGTFFVSISLNRIMSQAFVRENDDNGLLHQIEPTLPALLKYLQVENNGQRVSVVRRKEERCEYVGDE